MTNKFWRAVRMTAAAIFILAFLASCGNVQMPWENPRLNGAAAPTHTPTPTATATHTPIPNTGGGSTANPTATISPTNTPTARPASAAPSAAASTGTGGTGGAVTDWKVPHFARLEQLDPTFRSSGWTAWLKAAGVDCDSVRDARQPEEETNSSTGKISVSGMQLVATNCHVVWPNIVTTDVPSRIVSKDSNSFEYKPDPTNGSTLYTNVHTTGPVTIYASGYSWGQFTNKFGFGNASTGGAGASATATPAGQANPTPTVAANNGCITIKQLAEKYSSGIERNAQGARNGLLYNNDQLAGAVIKVNQAQITALQGMGWTVDGANASVKSAWSPESCRPLAAE